MTLRKARRASAMLLIASSMLFQGCPFSGFFDNCFGENTISRMEYDDLNFVEQLLYDENSCGRYDRRFGN